MEQRDFIQIYEWKGNESVFTTHRFSFYLAGILVGVLQLGTPYSPSGYLGKDKKHLGKSILRGATSSLAPVSTGSFMIATALKWMVLNTPFRAFDCFSDPMAGEREIIYSACHAIYLGDRFGSEYMYFDPRQPDRGWFSSDRFLRRAKGYRKLARQLGIKWEGS